MQWVYDIPSWLVVVIFIGGMSALSAGGLLLVWRFVPPIGDHNDVVGPVLSMIGTVLAVMLSFMVVTVWQEYDQAAAVVNTEAGEIADLFHESAAFPALQRDAIRGGLATYVTLVVRDEWPLMRHGQTSEPARIAINTVARVVELFQPTTMAQQNSQADAVNHAHNILDARRGRIFDNQQAVPPLLWIMMFFMGAVTVCSLYFFHVTSAPAHLLMTIALAAVIGAIFVMIAELDLPFRGDLQIPPNAYTQDVYVIKSGL